MDHKLRKNSTIEADLVKKLNQFKISSEILTLKKRLNHQIYNPLQEKIDIS